MSHFKQALLIKMQSMLEAKIEGLQASYDSAKSSRDNDTKSSAGDKFETGRAMMQQEMDKAEQQIALNQRMLVDLSRISPTVAPAKVDFGALVTTDKMSYFISVPLAKVETEQGIAFAVSLASPIGQALYEATVGDKIEFNGQQIEIKSIA